MQFYKFEGLIKDEKWSKENDNRRVLCEKIRKISLKTAVFNQRLNKMAFFYVINASYNTFTGGILLREASDPTEQIENFLGFLGIELIDIHTEEITFNTACNMLRSSSRNNYIDDEDSVLEQFDLDKLSGRFGRNVDYGENMIDEMSKAEVYNETKRFLAKDTLIPELGRIYAGKAQGNATGHPVHYMMETDDHDARKGMCRLLLSALYANGRLHNRRYCFADIRPGENFSMAVYDCLYKSNIGGAMIVRFLANDDSEDDRATCGRETVENLCEVMKKYQNQVLTVFCLPRECTKSKDIFYEYLGTASFVELKEDFATDERAKEFLKMLARDNGIRTDKVLFEKLQNKNGYLAPELRSIFDKWYNNKLKTTVYPQYKEIVTAKREVINAAPKGSAYDELMEMVGLSDAKKVIIQALNYFKAQKLFADKGMKLDRPTMHMVFSGNPGTAKTSVARLFARIMKENGLLSKGNLIEVGRGDLVGKYVGWTAPTIQKKFKEAKGSVLFIDEAYSLVDDRDGSYGDEAINTIVQEMENHRDDVVVIFAGYPDKMEQFLQKNPGLRSRIAFHVPFADYNVNELCDIARLIAKKKGLNLETNAYEKLASVFKSAQNEKDFGNGRYARNVIEKAKMAQATRLLAKDYELITGEDVTTLTAEDIDIPENLNTSKVLKIGFAS